MFLLHAASQLLIPVVLAVLISYALEPVVAWMHRRHIPRKRHRDQATNGQASKIRFTPELEHSAIAETARLLGFDCRPHLKS